MYNAWLIYNKQDADQNTSYIHWFIEEAKLQGIALRLILREDMTIGIINNKRTVLYNNQKANIPLLAIVRAVDPLLSLHLEGLGVLVFNSSFLSRICNNKELTYHHVYDLSIPMVDTIFTNWQQLHTTKPLDYPFVVKEATGRGGKQVFLIENELDWSTCLPSLSPNTIVLQSSNVMHGKDLRVFVVGREIVGAILRENSNDFRANYKLGGTATWYTLDREEFKLVNKIIQHFDFGMVGIDFLFNTEGQLLFNEIEDVVGSRTLSAVSDVNILQKYVTHIKKQSGISS